MSPLRKPVIFETTLANIRKSVGTLAAAEVLAPSVSGATVLDALVKDKPDAVYGPMPDDVLRLLLKPRPATLDELDKLTAWCALIGVETIIRRPEWVNWLDQNRETVLKASTDFSQVASRGLYSSQPRKKP